MSLAIVNNGGYLLKIFDESSISRKSKDLKQNFKNIQSTSTHPKEMKNKNEELKSKYNAPISVRSPSSVMAHNRIALPDAKAIILVSEEEF